MMDKLQELRVFVAMPLTVTSGYRSPQHSVEAAKEKPGTHTLGRAVDIQCSGERAFDILREALIVGFSGIGVSQSGDHSKRFLHLDDLAPNEYSAPRPAVWSY